MWKGPLEYFAHKFVLAPPAVSHVSCSSNLDCLRDEWFTYPGSSVTATENDINTRLLKTWKVIDRPSIIRKSDLSDKIIRNFFQSVLVSIQLYGRASCTLIKRTEKKLDINCTRLLRAILNQSWKQHLSKQHVYGHQPPILKSYKWV